MKQQYHIRDVAESDELMIREVFESAAQRFKLIDTKFSCLLEGLICNYSEGFGWGFGLGALRVGDTICVGLTPGKATKNRFQPVFDFIINHLQQAFGSRAVLASPTEEIDVTSLPTIAITDRHREFARALLSRGRRKDA